MNLPFHKIKIVCTIGPASDSTKTLTAMIKNGMSVARLNMAHGQPEEHIQTIARIRQIAAKLNCVVPILMDLPGTKMRIGTLLSEPMLLTKNQKITLISQPIQTEVNVIPVEFPDFTKQVSKGSLIFLNDGFIQLRVDTVSNYAVFCHVIIGGELLSHKGINIPGSHATIKAITENDLKWLDFGLRAKVSIFGLSFVSKSSDIVFVRDFAKQKGEIVYLVAKIERQQAIKNINKIINVSNGIMIARGDLGVEIPLQEVPMIQKTLIRKANKAGRSIITATQMLESMTHNSRPTRAEVADVANAILDGTDAIMLSEETAIGDYPVESVQMMKAIALAIEPHRRRGNRKPIIKLNLDPFI